MPVDTDEIETGVRTVTRENEYLTERAKAIVTFLKSQGIDARHDTHSMVKPDKRGTMRQRTSVWVNIYGENARDVAEAVERGCDGKRLNPPEGERVAV